ncbi:hypothetical protein IPM19_00070 [bacterium]|nr:MAG: hypothetical protein IPM19_00070 [bacterium]
MKLKPEKWTHNHSHRLYHMSMGVCFGFISLAVVGVMATVWMNAGAEDVNITALVEGVNPGPIIGGGGGPAPVPTPNPTINMVAEPQGQIAQRPINTPEGLRAADVFPGRPSYSGTTSVGGGLIFISVSGTSSFNSTAQADATGKWLWQSPVELIEGTYSITASVYDSYDLTRSGSTKRYFIVEFPKEPVPVDPGQPGQPGQPGGPGTQPGTGTGTGKPSTPGGPSIPTLPPVEVPAGPSQFGIFISIVDDYRYVNAGEKVIARLMLVSSTGQQVVAQDIDYKIISPAGKVILETTDTVSFSKQSQFLKTFTTAPETPAGEYTIQVSSRHNGITSQAQAKFNLLANPASAGTVQPQGPVVIWSLLILLWLLFVVLLIIAYRQVMHHHEEIKNNPTY